jgi:hypothetical protein
MPGLTFMHVCAGGAHSGLSGIFSSLIEKNPASTYCPDASWLADIGLLVAMLFSQYMGLWSHANTT